MKLALMDRLALSFHSHRTHAHLITNRSIEASRKSAHSFCSCRKLKINEIITTILSAALFHEG